MKVNNKDRNSSVRGGVSIIVVIFAALLMTIITISFIQLMLSDQKQATSTDLSQSAYDSAQAGVEDAKRVLLLNQSCQISGDTSLLCQKASAAMQEGSQKCNTIPAVIPGAPGDSKETMVQQSATTNELDQAFTCVKIMPNTADYLARLQGKGHSTSILVPLVGVGAFDKVRLSWYDSRDYGDSSSAYLPSLSSAMDLPKADEWNSKQPPVLRAQLLQTGPSFELNNFDDDTAESSNSKALFLYPSRRVSSDIKFSNNVRRKVDSRNDLTSVKCTEARSGYACVATIDLPNPIGGNAANRANAFLRLTAIYNDANLKVELLNGASVVSFQGVQPAVDSTGRASDLFRRIEARIELGSNVAYPEASIDTTGGLCKNFTITNEVIHYTNNAVGCV